MPLPRSPRRRSVLDDAIPGAADGGVSRASGTQRGQAQDPSVQLKLLVPTIEALLNGKAREDGGTAKGEHLEKNGNAEICALMQNLRMRIT